MRKDITKRFLSFALALFTVLASTLVLPGSVAAEYEEFDIIERLKSSTGIDRNINLREWCENADAFTGADISVTVFGEEMTVSLSSVNSAGTMTAKVASADAEAVRTAMKSHVTSSAQAKKDRYIEIARGSYIKLGTEYLRFSDDFAGNLLLDNKNDTEALVNAIHSAAYLDTCEDQGGKIRFFVKAGTKIAKDYTVTTLSDDILVTVTLKNEEITAFTGALSELSGINAYLNIVLKAVGYFDEFLDVCNGTDHVSVDVHVHVCDQMNTDAKYLKSAATTTEKAVYYYSCSCCDEHGEATFEYGDYLDDVTFDWAEDGKSATATVIPGYDKNKVFSGACEVSSSVLSAATYIEKGTTRYTATVTLGGREYTDTKDIQDIPMLDFGALNLTGGGTETKATYEVKAIEDVPSIVINSETPCVIFEKSGGIYIRRSVQKITDSSAAYDISDLPESSEIVIAFKGDANLDGSVDMNDATKAMVNWVNDNTDGLDSMIADVDGGGLTMDDASAIMCAWVMDQKLTWDTEN